MKITIGSLGLLTIFLLPLAAFSDEAFTVSGRAKAFTGPKGENITLVYVNEGKIAIVYAKDTYGINEGKAIAYEVIGADQDNPELGCALKYSQGAVSSQPQEKPAAYRVFLAKRNGTWTYTDMLGEDHKAKSYPLFYSDVLSKKIDTRKIIKIAKACQ
jgi:hypothetical protein